MEVISPHETAEEIREKVRDYLLVGTSVVWVVYPRTQEVVVHTPDGLARTYGRKDHLDNPPPLADFTCQVGELFDVT